MLACSGPQSGNPEAQPNGPQGLIVLDSIRLNESDSVFVASASGLAVSHSGDLFVADNANKRAYHFSKSGQFLGDFGRQGAGPGELSSFGALALVGDTLLVINNSARLRVEAFDVRTGTHVWGRSLVGRTFRLTSDAGLVHASTVDPLSRSSIVAYTVGADSMQRGGIVPWIFAQHPMLAGPFGAIAHDVRNGDMLQAFEASNYVFLSHDTGTTDSVYVPKVRRRGAATRELLETARDTSKGRDALYKSSVPVLAKILNDTTAAVVHSDFELAGTQFIGRYFLSLVNFRKGKVCIDLPLPVPQDPLPQFTMRADTLIALVQHVGDAAEARTFMVRMHVDAATCSWNYVGERL